jgi:ferric-dicitrate binding protein FerR (iron transport regulator)
MYETDLKQAWAQRREKLGMCQRVDLNDPIQREIRQALLSEERRRAARTITVLACGLAVAMAIIAVQAYLIVHAERIFGAR